VSKPTVTETQEDYLEAILILQEESGAARLSSIANHLNLHKSTVATTLQLLRKQGFVIYEPYKLITLTPTGARIARQIYRRHKALRKFLMEVLLLDEGTADETACKMEHGLSSRVIDRFVKFTEFVDECPYSDKVWLNDFGYFCTAGKHEECEHCSRAEHKIRSQDDKS